MKKSDKQMLEMLEKELQKSAESANVPLRLQKESVVAMLRNAEIKETDFSDKTGTVSKAGKGNIAVIRRLAVTAAMLAVVVVGVLAMRTGDGVKVVKTDSFYEGYKGSSPVRSVGSYEEVEKAVEEILGSKSESSSAEKTTAEHENASGTDDRTVQKLEQVKDSVIKGYGEYVAIANRIADSINENAEKSHAVNEPDGVATYGDFKADTVKTDGEYLYIASTGINSETGTTVEQIKIIRTVDGGGFEAVSDIILFEGTSKENFDECIEIYLKNNCLTAIMKRHEYSFGGTALYDNVSTVAVSYDISDPRAPVKIREHVQDGEYISSNLYENRLCIVTAKTIADRRATIPYLKIDGNQRVLKAKEIFLAVNDPEASYLFVTVTDIADFSKDVSCLAVLGCGKEIYCSSSVITVAREFVSVETDENNNRNSLTEIYRFNIKGSDIALSGSYIVQGLLADGVSVDESGNYLRAITTDNESSYVYVLDEKMKFVSGLKDIFPGEKISEVKFIGNNGYVIVDGTEDKTMIIDFSDPSQPSVAGTIDAKAFSDDLYEISDNILLGMSEDEEGIVTLTLFDVSDPVNPVTAAVYSLGESCRLVSSSDSRSVMLAAEKGVFGIPVLKKDEKSGTEISAYVIFEMSDGKITPKGTYNHALSYIGDAAVRGTFIDNILYTVSGEKVVSFDLTSETDKKTEFLLN